MIGPVRDAGLVDPPIWSCLCQGGGMPRYLNRGPLSVTIKGIFGYRVVCAVCFLGVGLLLCVNAISAMQEARRPFVALAELGLASVNMSLAGRSFFSRITVGQDRVALHSIWRTQGADIREVVGVVRRTFLGRPVLALELGGGRSIRVPLLTQPGDPKLLRAQEELLSDAIRRESGSSTTTP